MTNGTPKQIRITKKEGMLGPTKIRDEKCNRRVLKHIYTFLDVTRSSPSRIDSLLSRRKGFICNSLTVDEMQKSIVRNDLTQRLQQQTENKKLAHLMEDTHFEIFCDSNC